MKLIDGDELIELLMSTAITDKQREYSECVQYAVQKMPTVDAVPVRHGRWETVEDWDEDERYKCSVCGDEWFLEVGNPEFNNMNYCPNCGARMDGKGNGNEAD